MSRVAEDFLNFFRDFVFLFHQLFFVFFDHLYCLKIGNKSWCSELGPIRSGKARLGFENDSLTILLVLHFNLSPDY